MNDKIAYNQADAEHYCNHHRKNLRVRISTWRERRLAGEALQRLAPLHTLLDLASGTGRFWPVVRTHSDFAVAMDNSQAMLEVAASQVNDSDQALPSVVATAFQLPLADNSIDGLLCMRFMHHFFHAEDRLRALEEFHRVVNRGVVLSVWTNGGRFGNLAGRRRLAQQAGRVYQQGFGRRVCIASHILEAEYNQAGFRIVWKKDFLPAFSQWRFYVLEACELQETR